MSEAKIGEIPSETSSLETASSSGESGANLILLLAHGMLGDRLTDTAQPRYGISEAELAEMARPIPFGQTLHVNGARIWREAGVAS